MKKLMFAATIAAMSFGAMAEDAKPAAPVAPAAVEAAKPEVRMPPKFDRAKFEERMKARKAERDAKMIEVLKKYGLDEAKARECIADLEKTMRPQRPPRMARPPRPPKAAAPAPAAAPAAK